MKEWKFVSYDTEKSIFNLFPELCKGCGLCIAKCPKEVIIWETDVLGVYDTPTVKPKDKESCIACAQCETYCPDCAILIEKKEKPKSKDN